jgi:hypothetical protein
MHMHEKRRACLRLIWIVAVSAAALPAGAHATPSCPGSYATALLQPLPPHLVAGLDIHDRSPRNLDLAERFTSGLRKAGVKVGARPNVSLSVTASHLGDASGRSDRGSVSDYSDFAALRGGQQPRLPAMPATGLTTPQSPPPSPLLVVRVDARVKGLSKVAWVATVQCRMVGADEADFAEELGAAIGNVLGKRTERHPF